MRRPGVVLRVLVILAPVPSTAATYWAVRLAMPLRRPKRFKPTRSADKIARAQIIDVSKLSGSQVKFGATVTVVDEDTEDEGRYQIVGEHEADVKQGRISLSSPLSRAMIGKEVGEVVEVNTPGGVKAYEILKVEWV